ncbi:MAG TPA: hypothetical protein VGR58_02290 [Candidatus Acidoferrum sp.]|nr:hypothetical protein [Candidatus Acidoferrum sp.]
MNTNLATSTVGAPQLSPTRKRWENVTENFRSAVGAALTRELFHVSLPTPRSLLALSESREGRLRIGISLSSLNLSWSTN